jgi:Flp pilus assembly protein CpaB
MRKRSRVLLHAALVAAFVALVGFELSLESAPSIRQAFQPAAAPVEATAVVMAPVVLYVGNSTSASIPRQFIDVAGLLMVGTVLFGLSAVVRKAI